MCTSFLLQGLPVASYFKKPQHASENETWLRMQTTGVYRERTKKISSHSTNLFKYIQYKSIHIHYSAADITKSNVTKNPVGKVGERRKKLVHSNRYSIAFGRWRECNGLLLYRLLWSKPLRTLCTVAGLTALTLVMEKACWHSWFEL